MRTQQSFLNNLMIYRNRSRRNIGVAPLRLIIETLFQYTIVQELKGTQLDFDYTASIGFRYSF